MQILIVDDDEIILDMMEMMLRANGHSVVRAVNAPDALRIIEEKDIRFVISDWMMPNMTGLDLVKRIRSLGSSRGYIYTILLTSLSDSRDVVAGLEAGADDFITKPFNESELAVRVKAGERILSLETRHVAIFALAKLADSRDNETGMHLERMREFSTILAKRIVRLPELREKVPSDFVEMICQTSPLHDIGKVGIPDYVLLKPDRLSSREFEIMKTHTTIGAQTLNAAIEQFPEAPYLHMARDIALYHHERHDGDGYPEGLAGDEIPLSARIVALADVYDALVSKRVYKQALPHEVARSVIIQSSGKHFDPLVVNAFIDLEEELLEVSERMRG